MLVRITDRQEVISNIVHNYAEFGVEAIQRFRIERVVLEPSDGIVKICEVVLLDDEEQYQSLESKAERQEAIVSVKERALKLLNMYASLAKSESRTLLAMSIRISEASKAGDNVRMLFLIAYLIRY